MLKKEGLGAVGDGLVRGGLGRRVKETAERTTRQAATLTATAMVEIIEPPRAGPRMKARPTFVTIFAQFR